MGSTKENVCGERARGILQPSSSNRPRKIQQSKLLISFPQRANTGYRTCTGETYELARLPKPATTSSLEQSRVIEELNDRDLNLSNNSVQIDTPPDSSTSSGSLHNILGSSADLEESIRLYRAVECRGRHSLVPVDSKTNKRRPATPEDAIHDIQEILLMVASEYPGMAPQLFNAMGLEKGWGTGPHPDKALFSAFDQKLLQLELVARSNSSSTEHKKYAVGFDTKLFSQMFSNNPRATYNDSCNNENNCFKGAKIFPYRVIATQDVFQSYVNTILLPRRSAYGELCERLHPHSADQAEAGPEFKQVAGAFFAGREVPKDFTYGQFENTNSFQITNKGGNRSKVLDMKPLDDHTLVIFLEDCVMSNDLAAAESKNSKLFGMEILKGNGPNYDSMVKIEVTTTSLTLMSSVHESNHASDDEPSREKLKEDDEAKAFAKANALKKFLAQIPGALEEIPTLDAECLQPQDLSQDSAMVVPNSAHITGLAAAAPKGVATRQSKPKKKKNKKKSQKKSADVSHPSAEVHDAQESTLNDSSNFGDPVENSPKQNSCTKEISLSENKLSQALPLAFFSQENGVKELESTLKSLEIIEEYDSSDSSDCWEIVQPKGHKGGSSQLEKVTKTIQINASMQRKSSNSLALKGKKTFASAVSASSNASPLSTGSLASKTSKYANKSQSPATGKTANQNNNYNAKEPQREESFDERFPPLTIKDEITTSARNETEMKKGPHSQKAGSLRDSHKVENGEGRVSGVKPPDVTGLDATSFPDQPEEGNKELEAPKDKQELTVGICISSPAELNRGTNSTKSVSQQLPQESIGATNVHIYPSRVSRHSAVGKSQQLRNKKLNKGRAFTSEYQTNSEGRRSGARGVGKHGQYTRHDSRTSINNASAPLTAAKSESITTQVQPSFLPSSKDQLEPEPMKQTVSTQRVELGLERSQVQYSIKLNEPHAYHDFNPISTGSLSKKGLDERAGIECLASPGLVSASTGIKQDIEMEQKFDTNTTGLIDKIAVMKEKVKEIGSKTPPSLVFGFAGGEEETPVDHNLDNAANNSLLETKGHDQFAAEKFQSLALSGVVFGFAGVDEEVETAGDEEANDMKQGLSDAETRQREFDHEQLPGSIRNKCEESKDRARFSSPGLPSSVILDEENQNCTSGHFQTLAPCAASSTSHEEIQQDGAILLTNAENFLSFQKAPEVYIASPRNMMHPSQASTLNLGNNIPYIRRHNSVSAAYNRYHGFGDNMATADTHAHPTASSKFSLGNAHYLQPTNRDPALNNANTVLKYNLQDWNCTFCLARFYPNTENPAHFCPFCVNQGLIVYCSTSCQLADSYDHCACCQHNPSYERISASPVAPTAMRRIENYPVKSQAYDPVIPECYRQKAFSMLCRTGKFPDIIGLWNRVKQVEANGASTPDSSKHVGDYFIFRSGLTSCNPNQAPVDVICVITLDPNDAMKLPLRRMLNACYVRPTPTFASFLFRFIRHIISDHNIFSIMTSITSYASQADIVLEFSQQFPREFSFLPGNLSDQQPFSFRPEWECIRPTLELFERENQILGYWKTRDAACQIYW